MNTLSVTSSLKIERSRISKVLLYERSFQTERIQIFTDSWNRKRVVRINFSLFRDHNFTYTLDTIVSVE